MILLDNVLEMFNLTTDLILGISDSIFKSEKHKYDWISFWEQVKIPNVKYIDFKKQKYYDCYIFKVDYNTTKSIIESKREQLELFLNNSSLLIDQKSCYLYIKARNSLQIDNLYTLDKYKRVGYKIPIALSPTGNIIYYKLDNASNSNIYVAGTTRCGKSNLIRLLLTQLITMKKSDIQLSIINTKIVDLIEFENTKNTIHYTENIDEVISILEKNLEDMENRYLLFKKNNVKNIWEFREQVGKIPLRIIVIEELATFQGNKEFYEKLTQLASEKEQVQELLYY